MGREIRRVPANWQHPKYKTMRMRRDGLREIETYKPLLGRSFSDDAQEWDDEKAAWDRGDRPDYFDAEKYGPISFENWSGDRPTPEWYVPYDTHGDLPWWQMYETVSEGTPVTPAFATPDELIEHLATVGEIHEDGTGDGPWLRERAAAFVLREKSAPSFIISNGTIYDAKSGFPKG